MHRRSRTGCFTCRLRRKKCDEGKSSCRACKNLGLVCDYKRPMWWSTGEKRRQQKEMIKNVIKHTQLTKKHSQAVPLSANTPPSLCHSIPTSDGFNDHAVHTRAPSVESQLSSSCGFQHTAPEGYFAMGPPQHIVSHPQYPMFSPYEVDIKTERQIFVNDVPTRRDSTISTFSTYQPPPISSGILDYPIDSWVQQDYFESHTFAEEPVDFNFFEYPHGPLTPSHEAVIDVEECDQHLLNHFLDNVLRLIFPILDVNQHGSARSDVILPGLEANRCYLHCCLSISAVHLKATQGLEGEQIDNDIMRHRYATISELCEALGRDTDHARILEATLGMIFFQCSVGTPDDRLRDIPWHQHFSAATSLVNKLELPASLSTIGAATPTHPPFNMTLASWIDILGATMLGRSPVFADTYREQNMAGATLGLAELMGCEDRIMFLISEIACLEARIADGMDVNILCKYIEILGTEMGKTEPLSGQITSAISATGAIRPKQLCANMTDIFRLAARIYLCTLVPGYQNSNVSIVNLVAAFADAMNFIPAGPEGFDRSLVWPILMAGSVSLPHSQFRSMFTERCTRLGEAAHFGSFGRVRELLKDLWSMNDNTYACGERQSVHWRDVIQQKGWDVLLI
ncbi:DNA-binding transcriptional regulator ume6 [Elasticomyces elasticus]|nr:DNA-binding transcriptional regulator ume6 [Elasticomyces elasticus]